MSKAEFGGDWTIDKLERVRKYLTAYTTIFEGNARARKLRHVYVDAFAGSGYRSLCTSPAVQPSLDLGEPEADAFLKGSARIALEVEPPFKHYLFIEQDQECARELEKLKAEFPTRAPRVEIQVADANDYLRRWCTRTDWRYTRAVVFLDPYGMQVEWSLIESVARTRAIDLWLLFPLGVAVNRLLTAAEPPPDEWAKALSRLFGTDKWQSAFYPERRVLTLFGEQQLHSKQADYAKIGQFFVDRLKTVFAGVADNPLPLVNSKNTPLYLLCFASGNPGAAPTAIRIAQHILRR